MSSPGPAVVALRALGLGDFLTGLPALRALTDAFGTSRRMLAAPGALAPLVEPSGCGFDLVDTPGLGRLPEQLGEASVLVNLHGRGPQSHRALLALPRPDPGADRRLIAFGHPEVHESAGSPAWRPGEHEVARWCRLLTETGVPADPQRFRLDASAFPACPEACGATVLHPGASSAARRWPAERWAAVAQARASAGIPVLITGSATERELATSVAAMAGLPVGSVLAGATDVAQLASVIAAASVLACGDTGVAHLATAFGTPSVLLFGPTSPAEWGPPANAALHRVIWKGTTGDSHATTTDPGLLRIGAGEVLEALTEVAA